MDVAAWPANGKARRFGAGGLRLGLFWPYGQTTHVVSAALAARNPPVLSLSLTQDLARAAEDAGFDFIFIADTWWSPTGDVGHRSPMYDPSLVAAIAIANTRHVGIVTTIQGVLHQPAYIARIGAGLDHLSGGRWGWNIVTGSSAQGEGLFNVAHLDHDVRYDMAAEMLAAVQAIWASDPREEVRFEGRFYRFRGAMMEPRPVQRPHPLLVSASSSGYGQAFSARCCDYLFVNPAPEPEALREIADRMRRNAAAAGRPPGAVAILTSPLVIVRDTREEARSAYEWLIENCDPEAARPVASHRLRGVADPEEERRILLQEARGLRHFAFVGTAEDVAGQIADLYRQARPEGLLVSLPFWSPEETRRFAAVTRLLEAEGVRESPARRDWSW